MKKILCLVLSLVGFIIMSVSVSSEDFPTYCFTIDGFTYEFSHGAIMPEFQVDKNSMLLIIAYNGEKAVDINRLSNGLPGGLYFYQIAEAAGIEKDDVWAPHWEEYVKVDTFVTSIKVYDSSFDIKVKATVLEVGTTFVEFADQMPVLMSDRTMLPIRAIAELYGWNVSWDGEKQEVLIESSNKKIKLCIGDNWIFGWNFDSQKYEWIATVDQEPIIINGRTMLPIRGVAEALGLNVEWIGEERCVVLS